MSLFGILFVIVGVMFLMSPILPGSNVEGGIDKMIVILIGIFFVLYGIARTTGVENHPVSNAIAVALVVVVFALAGYSIFMGRYRS